MADETKQPGAQLESIQLPASAFTSIKNQVRSKGPDFQRVYTNSIAIQVSPWDLSLIFGQLIGNQEDGKPIIEETLQVTLTAGLAKALGGLLALHIANYESQMGEIKLPLSGKADSQPEDEPETQAEPTPAAK